MKKLIIFILVFLLHGQINNAFSKEIILEKPDLQDSFLKILNNRKSTKKFDNKKEIDNKTLSEILWAAYGVNRNSGSKRTISTAFNRQHLQIYVIKKDSVWLYNAKKQSLNLVLEKNLFPLFAKQSYVNDASIILLYTTKKEDDYALMEAGSSYQNVALYCAKNGLGSTIRSYFNKDSVAKELKIDDDNIIISQVIGYEKH